MALSVEYRVLPLLLHSALRALDTPTFSSLSLECPNLSSPFYFHSQDAGRASTRFHASRGGDPGRGVCVLGRVEMRWMLEEIVPYTRGREYFIQNLFGP